MTITALTDSQLLEQARTGDEAAFTELYVRHQPAALRLARSYRRFGDPDDLVNGAFERLLSALRRGSGPTESFRAYLFVTLRRLAAEQGERPAEQSIDEVPEPISAAATAGDLVQTDRELITRAFEDLPDRWQAVLWHTAVEGRQPRELADVLGVTANAAAAMSYRARERLRQSYLQAHLLASPAPEHEPFRSQLGAYVRGGLSKRDQAAVERHLESCESCRALVAELNDVNRSLARAVLPLFILVGGGQLAAGAALGGAAAGDKGIVGKLKHVAQTVGSTAAIAAVVGGIVGMGTILGREDGGPVDSAADAADLGNDGSGSGGDDDSGSGSGGDSDSLFGDDDFAVSPFDDRPAPGLGAFDDFGDDFAFDDPGFDDGFGDDFGDDLALGGGFGDDFGDDFALGDGGDLVSPTTLPPPASGPATGAPPSSPSNPSPTPPSQDPPPTRPPTTRPPTTTPPPTTPPPTTPPPTTPPPTTPPPTTPPPTTPPPTTPPPPALVFTDGSAWTPTGPDAGDLFIEISAEAAAGLDPAASDRAALTLEVTLDGEATFAGEGQPEGCTPAGSTATCTFARPAAGGTVGFTLLVEGVRGGDTATARITSDGRVIATLPQPIELFGLEAPAIELSGAVWLPNDDDTGDLVITLNNPGETPIDGVVVTIQIETGRVMAGAPPAGCAVVPGDDRQIRCDVDPPAGETVLTQPLTVTGEGQAVSVTVAQGDDVVGGPQRVPLTELPAG